MAFTVNQKVLFRHCDPAGIVFYPRYFEMINDCVEAFFDAELGFPFSTIHDDGAVPTAEIRTRFRAPSRLGDDLSLDLKVTKLGRTSLGLEVHARCETQTRFTAESTLVFVDGAGKPSAWPDSIRKKITTSLERDGYDKPSNTA
ncbi:MAG: acyl-CoA thioesterase [Shimia sp.]|nr:acyl-CoA thioesterase [Shimia sp.]